MSVLLQFSTSASDGGKPVSKMIRMLRLSGASYRLPRYGQPSRSGA